MGERENHVRCVEGSPMVMEEAQSSATAGTQSAEAVEEGEDEEEETGASIHFSVHSNESLPMIGTSMPTSLLPILSSVKP